MSAGTNQYTSVASLATLTGDTDLTVTASTDKVYLVDPTGARNLDLFAVSSDGTGATTSRLQIQIVNQCTTDAGETITLRDGNNSDAKIGIVEEFHGTWCEWNGTSWVATSGAT